MSNALYPVLQGIGWSVKRAATFNTRVHRGTSGASLSAQFYTTPIRRWTMTYNLLRQQTGFTELDTIAGFFNARNGRFDSFLFEDPEDKAVTAMGFGVGNASTTAFQLQRAIKGTFIRSAGAQNNALFVTTPRVNFTPLSEQPAGWSLISNGSAVPPVNTNNYAIAPDGTLTAGRVVCVVTGSTGADYSLTQWYTSSTALTPYPKIGDTAVASIWMRTNDGATVSVQLTIAGNTINTVVTVTPTWQRFFVTGALSTDTAIGVLIGVTGTMVNKGADLLVWGAQAETGTTPTDYIKNATSVNVQVASPAYWPASADGFEPIYTVNQTLTPVQIYKSDWQGNQLQYASPRTNLALQSAAVDNASWTKGGVTITANTSTAPDGTLTADTMTNDATVAEHRAFLSPTTGKNTTSIYAKAGTASFISLSQGGGSYYVTFNLTTGAIVANVGGATADMVAVGQGWYRCTMRNVIAVNFLAVNMGETLANAQPGVAAAGTSKTVILWGAQSEATLIPNGPATSYIPTTTAAVTVTDYTLSASGLVTFASAPALYAALTWTGSYYWRTAFMQDEMESDEFMYLLYQMGTVELEQVR